MSEIVVIASGNADSASVIARRVAAEGAAVAVLASDKVALRVVVRDLVKLGAPAALALPCDIAEMSEVMAAAQRIEAELGPIDRWINVAMTDYGYVCGTRAALAAMGMRDRGTIVQVSPPGTVRTFTDGLRGELRLGGSHIVLETLRTQALRRVGAAALAGAAVLGAALLRRVAR